jgi:adenylate cyclase
LDFLLNSKLAVAYYYQPFLILKGNGILSMPKKIDYTATAQRLYARFPILTYLSIQVNFWVIANLLLGVLMHLQALRINQILNVPGLSRWTPLMVIAIVLGILYGVTLGLTDYYLDRKVFKKQALGKVILFKAVISLSVLMLLLGLIRILLLNLPSTSNYTAAYFLNHKSWEYLFYILVIYYFFMTLLINFINQVNRKYGPGILLPLLLGKYKDPREEERIFLFMDLTSSTTMAEKLGHLTYSAFIRDCFMDINQVLLPFNAQVYQYVGDEIVVTWGVHDGLRDFSCIRFFFACEQQFRDRATYYTTHYGALPHFKAGLHMGKVTAVEIGEIKRDIAFHGDTLNTAARIQSVCNEYHKKFLVSEFLLENIGFHHCLKTESLGRIQLRGKTATVGIASVDWVEGKVV